MMRKISTSETQSYYSANSNPSSIYTERCQARCITPLLDLDVEHIPFTVSFSEGTHAEGSEFHDELMNNNSRISIAQTDVQYEDSYELENITNIKDIEPQWSHDEIDEIVLISSRRKKTSEVSESTSEKLEDIKKDSTSKFTLLRVLVDSSSTVAYLARNESNSKIYALKSVKKDILFPRNSSTVLSSKPSFLRSINGFRAPFLPKLYEGVGCKGDDKLIYLVTEYLPGCDLSHRIKCLGGLSEESCQFYAREITEAITYLHLAGIVHGNITAENIIFATDGHIILSGFDFAKSVYSSEVTTQTNGARGLNGYEAPELLLGWKYNSAIDCWAFGVVLYFMLFGSNFHFDGCQIGTTVVAEANVVHNSVSLPPHSVHQKANDLLLKCLERNPALRYSIEDIRSHEYFNQTDWDQVRAKRYPVPFIPEKHGDDVVFNTTGEGNLDLASSFLNLKEKTTPSMSPIETTTSLFNSPARSPTIVNSPMSMYTETATVSGPLSSVTQADVPQCEDTQIISTKTAVSEPRAIRSILKEPPPLADCEIHPHDDSTLRAKATSSTADAQAFRKRRPLDPVKTRASMISSLSLTGNSNLNECQTPNKLRKKYRSTGNLASKKNVNTNSNPPNLPKGITQIGLGIGYTHAPFHSRSRISLGSVSAKSCYGKLSLNLRKRHKHRKDIPAALVPTSPAMHNVYGSSWSIGRYGGMSTASFGAFEMLESPIDSTGRNNFASPSLYSSVNSPYLPAIALSPVSI